MAVTLVPNPTPASALDLVFYRVVALLVTTLFLPWVAYERWRRLHDNRHAAARERAIRLAMRSLVADLGYGRGPAALYARFN